MATNLSKNTATPIQGHTKAGEGYNYDSSLTYDAVTDPISGNPVFYDSIGTAVNPTNATKTAASPTNEAKS